MKERSPAKLTDDALSREVTKLLAERRKLDQRLDGVLIEQSQRGAAPTYPETLRKAAKVLKMDEADIDKAFGHRKGELIKKFDDRSKAVTVLKTDAIGTAGCAAAAIGFFGLTTLIAPYNEHLAAGSAAATVFFAAATALGTVIFLPPNLINKNQTTKAITNEVEKHKQLEHKQMKALP